MIVSGNDAKLHIYKINFLPGDRLPQIHIEDATSKFLKTNKCKFESDVLHIHVEHITKNECIIAIATEFGEIKFFQVVNKQKKS